MLRVAICEDDPACMQTAKDCIARFETESGCACAVSAFSDAVNFLDVFQAGMFDLVFMDIQMPHLSGMDAAKLLRKTDPFVSLVFVTDLRNRVAEGYEVEAMDFIVKPMRYPKCEIVLKRAAKRASRKTEELLLTSGGDLFRIAVEDILYVEVQRNRCFYYTADGVIEIWSSLRKEEERLSAYPFVKANSCYLVNLAHIKGISSETVQVGGERLSVSRSKRKELMEAFTAYMAENHL